MKVYKCDFCEQISDCKQRDIEGKEYDICGACWNDIEQKIKGKGREKVVEVMPWVPVYPYVPWQDTTRWIPEPKYPTWTITCGDTTSINHSLVGRTTTGGGSGTIGPDSRLNRWGNDTSNHCLLAPINTDALDITYSN